MVLIVVGVLACVGIAFGCWLRMRHALQRAREAELRVTDLAHAATQSEQRAEKAHTKRAQTEELLRVSEDQLRQSQKFESLGLLAGGIAHDFNNLLAVISNNATLLEDSVPADSRELVSEIDATVMRAAALTRQLLAFSRKSVTAPQVLDLNAMVGETQRLLRRMIGAHVRLETSLEPDLASVFIDPSAIVQVLLNLAVNARDAMPKTGGRITISTRNEGLGVILRVADTGCGMKPEVRDRVFEPFFTTKEPGKGTGMGLAVVHGIVRQTGGTIDVESEVGAGSTFTIGLPAVPADTRVEPRRTTRNTVPFGVETLVVVDDDAYVLKSAARGLRMKGYNVIETTSPMAALRALDKTHVDMLVTDVVMPQMDGRELAEIATAAHPALKVLYMSGCVDDLVLREAIERDQIDLIEKPFKSKALAQKVREVLDAAAA